MQIIAEWHPVMKGGGFECVQGDHRSNRIRCQPAIRSRAIAVFPMFGSLLAWSLSMKKLS